MSASQKPSAILLKDYRAPTYLIDQTDLVFNLGPLLTTVEATLKIRLQESIAVQSPAQSPALVLQGHGQQLLQLKLNSRELTEGEDYSLTEHELVIHLPPRQFTLTILSSCNPKENTSLEGLYVTSGRFCTQCEAHGFRKITYYLDRPDVLARFTTKIIADRKTYPILLSNGNKIDAGELEHDKHYVVWEDPYPKPAYLFALVAGDLACLAGSFTTKSGRKVALEIYTEEENISRCQHAMTALEKSMRWDEEVYGLEYDLDQYMIVAVNDFNMGAMENKGLNIFNAKYVLASQDTATDQDFLDVETVIGHEYFHNWTGNRVTLRDWFQLSLKEGLTVFRDQEFTADMSSRAVRRIEDVAIMQTSQFIEDEGPTSHPVRPASYIEMNNFYTVTVYNKGAEVIRMLHTLLGHEGFHQGFDLYIARHDGKAVTCDDFVQAMEDANGVDLQQFRHWYDQAGTPEVDITTAYDALSQTFTITAQQTARKTADHSSKKPWHIPVRLACYDQDGQTMVLKTKDPAMQARADQVVLHLTKARQQFVFTAVPTEPVPSLLQGFSAPVRLATDLTTKQLQHLLACDQDPVNQWQMGQQLMQGALLDLITTYQNHGEVSVPAYTWFATLRDILVDQRRDPALTAHLLHLPGYAKLGSALPLFDIEAMAAATLALRTALAKTLFDDLCTTYQRLATTKFSLSAQAMAARSLRNQALELIYFANHDVGIELAEAQYYNSNNMTDTMAALTTLAHHDGNVTDLAIKDFYQRHHGNQLVVNKWLGVQARSDRQSTVATVADLLGHESFDLTNPNKVYALLCGFASHNWRCFHDASGAGYDLISQQIIKLNRINPQVAARLISAFFSWKKFDESRAQKMRQCLQNIRDLPDLSDDLYELTYKALG